MTPKEKALQLYWKYYNTIEHTLTEEYSEHETFLCKQCALIAVDEMLANAGMIWGGRNTETGLTARDEFRKYWQEVKQEIEKL